MDWHRILLTHFTKEWYVLKRLSLILWLRKKSVFMRLDEYMLQLKEKSWMFLFIFEWAINKINCALTPSVSKHWIYDRAQVNSYCRRTRVYVTNMPSKTNSREPHVQSSIFEINIHWNFNRVKLKDMSLKLNTEENCVVDWRKVIGRRGQVLNPEASTKLDKFCRLNRFVLSSATFLQYIDFSDNGRNVIYRFQRILNKNNYRFF